MDNPVTHQAGIEFSVVIPFFNEEKNIEKVVQEVSEAFSGRDFRYELVLVDNGSSDETLDILRRMHGSYEYIKIVRVATNIGFGWGILQGFSVAEGRYLGFMGGDGQSRASDLLRIFHKVRDGRLDMVKALRVQRWDGWQRRCISGVYNSFFSWIFGFRVQDVNGSPKVMTRECFKKMNLVSRDWFLDAEIVLKAVRNGMRTGDVPVVFGKRDGNRSKVTAGTCVEFVRNILRYRFGDIPRHPGMMSGKGRLR